MKRLAWGAVAALALGLWLATPALIHPDPSAQPWYGSSASFPRLGLALVALGALCCAWPGPSRHGLSTGDAAGEELDASGLQAQALAGLCVLLVLAVLAIPVLGLGPACALLITLGGRWLGLRWRDGLLLGIPTGALLWAVFVLGLQRSFGG